MVFTTMGRTVSHLSISLDGFVAGPDQGPEHQYGRGGYQLHEWARHADEPGYEPDRRLRGELLRPMGAYVMGRNMFGPIRGEWIGDWRGWWGEVPPYHAPVFVLTHHAREPFEMAGGTVFNFVTKGFGRALVQARDVAGDADVRIAGGASTVRQALRPARSTSFNSISCRSSSPAASDLSTISSTRSSLYVDGELAPRQLTSGTFDVIA